jgi:hypothetical protein
MMSSRRSDFVEDRDFNFDAPADDAPLKEKLEHQKKLRKACEYSPDKPFDWPWFDPFMVVPSGRDFTRAGRTTAAGLSRTEAEARCASSLSTGDHSPNTWNDLVNAIAPQAKRQRAWQLSKSVTRI